MSINLRDASALLFIVSVATILIVLGLEHIGGYAPCPLCLYGRWAFYAAIPLSAAAWFASSGRPGTAAILIALCGLAFVGNTGFSAYHAGVEWKFWPGPASCAAGAGPVATEAGSLLDRMRNVQVIRCDEAALRIFGISLAGYAAILSLLLAAFAFYAVSRQTLRSPRHG